MERHATEIEQVARQAILGTTMEIDLGVRSWSNVSPRLSTSALLYDSAWKRAIAVHGDKPKAWKASGIWPSKKVAFSLVVMLAASSAIGFGMTQFMGNQPPASAAVQVPAPQPQPKQAAVVAPPSPAPTIAAVASQVAVAAPAPVVAKAEEQNAPQPPVIASSVEPVQPAPAVKTPPAAVKPVAPVPAHREEKPPVKAAIVLPAVPSFPAPLGLPTKASELPPSRVQEPSSAPAKEQPLLAVDETAKSAQASARATEKPEASERPQVSRPSDADTEPSPVEPKPAVKPAAKLAEPKVTEQPVKLAEPRETPRRVVAPAQPDKPLPIYTVLAPSAGGVVISDPETRLPKEFRVGQKLPSGEMIKSVTKSGEVVTDRRTLKMSE